jgi:alkanesulfonate monooxygenase SsuD/methylene tetrahydromethanopterin reductase-like flavin-dependent oxidoreductase (luciferase family)
VVTADHASGGRVELGLGAGWFEREHAAYGFRFAPPSERFGMLEEQVEIVSRLWSRQEPEVSFEGRHYRLEACQAMPKPLQDPHPPLIIGGAAGPRAARLAARWADEYNVNGIDPDECRRRRGRLVRACEEAGRDPTSLGFSLMNFTLVGADRAELERRASRLMARRGQSGEPGDYVASMGPDGIAGTVDQVVQRLGDYAEAGVERVMLQHLLHDDLEAVALIGSEVIPRVASM